MRRRMHCLMIGLAVMLLGDGRAAAAQSAVSGIVVAVGDSARPLRDVELTLDRPDRVMRSDSLGRFRFVDVVVGDHYLRARRLGLETVLQPVTAVEGREQTLRLAMRPSAQAMATIQVAGKAVTYPARLAEPYSRVSRATGTFFTREQIDSLFPLDLQSLLMRVPGVHVKDSKSFEFVRCRLEGHVQVWVDGTRLTSYSTGNRSFDRDASDALRDITPSSVQLMEVYVGPSRIPGQYLDDACAVILIWRK